VRYVLEGSVRRSGGRVRITAQLVDAASGGHVWAERYDRDLTDIFAVQDDITANIVTAIGPELTRAEIERARQKRPENLDAWDRYLRALSHLYRIDRDANRRAQALLAEAAELDPQYAGAHAWLAWSYTLDALLGWSASATESLQRAFQTAQTALALDRDDPLAHASVSIVLAFSGQHAKAVDAAERALELDPNFSVARGNLGIALAFVGRAEEAIGAFDRALRGSPRDPFR
jgi:adenylate cyclase